MTKHLRILFVMLMGLLGVTTGWAETKSVTISPTQALNDGGVSPITIVCEKGDGTSNPAISSGQLRLYQAAKGNTTGNTMTVSSTKTITSIVFTFANNMTADNGAFSNGTYSSATSTWSGSTNSVTLTVTGTTSGQRIYITEMVVYYEDSSSSGKTVQSIALSGNYQTEFIEGEAFNHDGVIVTATYDDTTTGDVTEDAEFSQPDMTQIGDQPVTVTYGEQTATYTITISEAPSHTATFSVNGTTTTADVKEGAAITFPADPADIEGKSFVGWTDTAIDGTTNVEPDFVTSATMGDQDVTFYAVFANVEGNQETATLTASHTTATSGYEDHTYTDDNGNTWSAYNNEPYENNVARFGLNKTSSPARHFTSPEFSGNITSIVIMPYNGSSSATRSFYINSAIGEKGDLGTIEVSPGIKLTEELTATLGETAFDQFYLQVSDALGFSYIKVTYGDMSYSDYCTTVEAAATESITISAALYATYITTNALDFTGTAVTAFIVDEATTANVHFAPVTIVPAATPIVVKAAAAGTYDIPVTTDDPENVGTNLLLAPEAGQTSTGVEYCLANKSKGIGFYPVSQGVAIKKAYLVISTTGAPEFIGFIEDGGISTGISTVAVENAELNIDAPMYNIAGQRVSRSYKGVVIQNGKKFVVK
ncbi:MAG: InlB B-repeat-containing protein [Prevotella sp.]|nr:InlB B-repeat-containing protein [Prevotella sp.]